MLMELALNQVQLNIFVKVKKVVNPSISKVQIPLSPLYLNIMRTW